MFDVVCIPKIYSPKYAPRIFLPPFTFLRHGGTYMEHCDIFVLVGNALQQYKLLVSLVLMQIGIN